MAYDISKSPLRYYKFRSLTLGRGDEDVFVTIAEKSLERAEALIPDYYTWTIFSVTKMGYMNFVDESKRSDRGIFLGALAQRLTACKN